MSSLRNAMATSRMSDILRRNGSNCRKETAPSDRVGANDDDEPWAQASILSMNTDSNRKGRSRVDGCLLRTCLRPKYSLRHQLFLSFGLVSILSLSVVMVTAIVTAVQAGAEVKDISRGNLQQWALGKLKLKSRFVADTIDQKLRNYESMVGIISEVMMDRFAGYPAQDDSSIPFPDSITGENIYPLQGSLIPIDWEIEQFPTNEEDIQEVLPGHKLLQSNTIFSTNTCGMKLQGACNPAETNTSAPGYYPLCSDANNNITVGGVLQPTETFSTIHRKSSDYCSAVLRPLREYHDDIGALGMYFFNSGAGLSIQYPANQLDSMQSYISAGCEWMRKPNPLNQSEPLGTEEEIARCHPAGERVPIREYNPLERPWYSNIAQKPHAVSISGPHEDAYDNGNYILLVTRSVFDRKTNKLIAVIASDIQTERFSLQISKAKITESSEVALVRWQSGVVVVSDRWDRTSGIIGVTQLGLGIDAEVYEELKETFQETYHGKRDLDGVHITISVNGRYISSSPVPIPPKEYDPNYQPQLMVISVILEEDLLAEVERLDDEVDKQVNGLIRNSLITGCIGLIVVILVIYVVSLYLTKPLQLMNEIGDQIVNDLGDTKSVEYEKSQWVRFSPRTEITDLVIQFQRMVKKFSGAGVAKLFKKESTEVSNPFELHSNFLHLYEARKREGFKYQYREGGECEAPLPSTSETYDDDNVHNDQFVFIQRVHLGHNVRDNMEGDAVTFVSTLQETLDEVSDTNILMRSPLFWWIVGSITVPLLVAMIVISVLVAIEVSQTFPQLTDSVEAIYVNLEKSSLQEFARLRAAFASEIMFAPIRDLYVATRIAGWLLFGVLQRTDSYVNIMIAAEACKNSEKGACDYYADKKKVVCDCDWDDPWGEKCYDYAMDTRSLQLQYFEGQSDDAWPNGDRNFTSFPQLATTPGTTSFWPDMEDLPGAEKRSTVRGYETTYDRMRVLSATSMINVPLYNYGIGTRLGRNLGVYIGLEAGGSFGGYAGCYHYYADFAHWQLTEDAVAGGADPELCPLEKYGFDPRCRQWYVDGKKAGLKGGDLLHATSPYVYAGAESLGQSAGMSVIDPLSGEFVGETLIDFSSEAIMKSLTLDRTPLHDGFHILISPQPDKEGSDAIVAPGFEFGGHGGQETASIVDLVLPDGDFGSGAFGKIVDDMRAGGSKQTEFTRRSESGGEETIYFAYASVVVNSLAPVDASDWNRGVKEYKSHIFSLALGESAAGISAAFDSIEESLEHTANIAVGILSGVILLAFLSVLYLSSRVTVSIITPVAQLLLLTTKINSSEVGEELPNITGGSSEVSRVHQTFERLHMVVRFANTAFFSGDLTKSYENLTDALALFTKLENSKAIGIANNNLGNTMLTMYRTMKKTGSLTMCGFSKATVVTKGIAYFDATIDIGERALTKTSKEEGWSTNYLIFMQQLSNRYFNRAMFLLSVTEDHPSPGDAEQQGFTDLATAKDMDREVVDNGDQHGFHGGSDLHFDLLLGRVKGILLLSKMGYEDEWGIEELLVDASDELNAALSTPAGALFRDLEPAAQMQRLDAGLIAFYMMTDYKDVEKAATVAIRMLAEDEYILGDASVIAVKALIDYVAEAPAESLGNEDPSNVRAALFQCRQKIIEATSLSRHGKDFRAAESKRQSNIGDISMEIF